MVLHMEGNMKAEFHIQGMHCESCAVDIKEDRWRKQPACDRRT